MVVKEKTLGISSQLVCENHCESSRISARRRKESPNSFPEVGTPTAEKKPNRGMTRMGVANRLSSQEYSTWLRESPNDQASLGIFAGFEHVGPVALDCVGLVANIVEWFLSLSCVASRKIVCVVRGIIDGRASWDRAVSGDRVVGRRIQRGAGESGRVAPGIGLLNAAVEIGHPISSQCGIGAETLGMTPPGLHRRRG